MASYDEEEEGEILPDRVTNYYLVDHKEEIVSFTNLPIQWSEDNIPDCSSIEIYLHGCADNGLQKVYKVILWKFELSFAVPEIYVLSKDRVWLKLQQPRRSFVNTIKATLITVHSLHFIKRNPGASQDDIFNHLLQVFSSFDVEPSRNDLLVHKPIISEAITRDYDIAKSEYLVALLLDMPGDRNASYEQDNRTTEKSKFVVDPNDESDNDGDKGDDSDEDMLFDSVCAFCDNGGDVLCCEGRCIRSFHATEEAGADTLCASLGYTDAQIDAMRTFLCKNCQYQQHQCFACGKLGSSDKSLRAEVFPCVSATCGHFYHPNCVAELLHPENELQADQIEKKISDGESFLCPSHKCFICKQGEDKNVRDLQFAVCRRCPKAYHRQCLPMSIGFKVDMFRNINQRAWDDLLPNRILIYCMDHKIIPELGTPKRDHIIFPGVDGKKQQHRLKLRPVENVVGENYFASRSATERAASNMPKKLKKTEIAVTGGCSPRKYEKGSAIRGFNKRSTDAISKSSKASFMCDRVAVSRPSTADKSQPSLRRNEKSMPSMRFPINGNGKGKSTTEAHPVGRGRPPLDAELETRVMTLIKNSTASFDRDKFIEKQISLSSNSYTSRSRYDKTITRGKVEASVKAVRAALKKLEEGCSIEDAKAVCEPQVLKQIFKWKGNLSVYLSPFLHGMRYTSFGRHFTKVDKLKEIVYRLHWYVQEGDMIVDFCCGSNDFSWLLKEKLQQMGKTCSFKNYDLIQSKNDFNFEKRDWMTVRPEELPSGSQLIMGLNPPFGVHAARANEFIEKALTFKPKLLILIVPRVTKRLDTQNHQYDLIWQDNSLLAGKSFYLPGSVDIHDQQMEQWNLEAPPLYLWSRSDWTMKHNAIALAHGHTNPTHDPIPRREPERVKSNYLLEETQDCFGDFSNIINGCGDISRILDDVPEDCGYNKCEGSTSSFMPYGEDAQFPVADGWQYNQYWNNYTPYDLNGLHGEVNRSFGKVEASYAENFRNGAHFATNETCTGMENDVCGHGHSSPANYPV